MNRKKLIAIMAMMLIAFTLSAEVVEMTAQPRMNYKKDSQNWTTTSPEKGRIAWLDLGIGGPIKFERMPSVTFTYDSTWETTKMSVSYDLESNAAEDVVAYEITVVLLDPFGEVIDIVSHTEFKNIKMYRTESSSYSVNIGYPPHDQTTDAAIFISAVRTADHKIYKAKLTPNADGYAPQLNLLQKDLQKYFSYTGDISTEF